MPEALDRMIPRPTIAECFELLLDAPLQVRLTAYDGSAIGPEDSPYRLHLANERGLAYIVTAPGDLGMGRAYVSGDLQFEGVHPGDPYEAMDLVKGKVKIRPRPSLDAIRALRGIGISHLVPPPLPPEEALPTWRRVLEGARHSKARDAEAIHHHYDVSNRFYEMVLGPSMTYTCACYPSADASLEEAQAFKYDLVCRKLGLEPGMRLLDVGCGWGGMVRHAVKNYGVTALGVTLSREQATWAQEAIKKDGFDDVAEVRHGDYRDITETGFDAVSSIGLTEHIGVRNYPAYFSFLRDRMADGARLLNHCITRPHNRIEPTGAFIDRYVFPEGELNGVGRIISVMQDNGLEVVHAENLREHYAMTLAGWSRNLTEHWEDCVAEAGEGRAKVWGLYMAGSRIAFERNELELHHVLALKTPDSGESGMPLRPTWVS
jgi:cyclopropane-fatty-acyl-phospholipid synthase